MIEAANEAGVTLMVTENVWFDPTLQHVRDLLHAGVIGAPALVRITREANLGEDFLANRQWSLDREQAAGGIMMSGGIHDVEKCRMLLDAQPISVYAAQARQRIPAMEGDDTSTAIIRFDDGSVVVLVESFNAMKLETAHSEHHTLEIDGEAGSIEIDGDGRITVFTPDQVTPWTDHPTDHRTDDESTNTFEQVVEHFLDCIDTNAEPITSGRTQRLSLKVISAAYESMASNQVVSIE